MVKMTVLKNKNIKFIYKGAFLMKKVIAILMVILLFTVMFYGCGKGKVKDTTLSSVTTATTGTTENTTTPPVNTTVDHVKEYNKEDWIRQLDNLKYGEAPEYLKQIGKPSEEDVAFIREQEGDIYYLVSDPAQVWDKAFYESTYRCAYIGTFDIGDGESIVYFKGLPCSNILSIISPSFAYYKKSGKVTRATPQELEEYEELFALRYSEYLDFFNLASEIIYRDEYNEKEWDRQLYNLKYGEVPGYLKQIGVPSEEDVAFIREQVGDRYYLVSDPAQVWDKAYHESSYICLYMGTFDIGDGESVVYFHGTVGFDIVDTIAPSFAYYKKSGKVIRATPRELEEYEELFSLRCREYIDFSDVVSWIIYNGEYDEKEWKRQLDNLKYGEVPEYLKQIGVPSEEDVAFIRKELGDGYCLISDPRQIWNKDFHETRNRSVYIGTFDIGDGESIVYFMGINSSGGAVIVAPSVSYYKKSGKIMLTDGIPRELEIYEELFSLRYDEYLDFSDVAAEMIYNGEYDEKEWNRQLDNLKYGEVPEYLKQIGVPSKEDMDAIYAKFPTRYFIIDPRQIWNKDFLVNGGTYLIYCGTFDLENGESVMYFSDFLFPGEDMLVGDWGTRNIAYYKQSGELVYRANNIEELHDKRELIRLRVNEYLDFYDTVLEIVYNTNKGE